MIKFEGREFKEVNKFDCHVCSFDNYSTVLPISPKDYRDKEIAEGHTMSARVVITEDDKFTHFDITDDWEEVYRVSLTNDMTKEIEVARVAAVKQGII